VATTVPTIDGLKLSYVIETLPPGRLPLWRWRWELWHGPTLAAAGWRLSERDAGRALRRHATAFAHRFFGLPAPAGGDPRLEPVLRPGEIQRVERGPVSCLLVPRALETAEPSAVS
jgi:hypothetical protein